MCDHLGEYKIYTRMVGYWPVRVYYCESCHFHMAMDTLPEHLITRMYQLTRNKEPICGLPQVDLCVPVGGSNALLLSRIFFYSLFATTSLDNIVIHLVNRGLSTEEFDKVRSIVPNHEAHNRPPVPERIMRRASSQMAADVEWTCNWCLRLGNRDSLLAISHFDIFFVADFLTYLRKQFTPKTAMLGQHRPFMLMNRRLVRRSKLGFCDAGPFFLVPIVDQPKELHLYHKDDQRITNDALRTGFDVGELLELELRVLGWEVNPMREEFDKFFYHFDGGDRVHSGPEFDSIQRRANMFINGYNIP